MDWVELLQKLKDRGWTQTRLAERIGKRQSSISDLARGEVKNPEYLFGKSLVDLYESGELPDRTEAKAA